jgi:hypothetical protein
LSCNEDDAGVALCEFAVGGLKLSQLVSAVGSPCAANEDDHEKFAAEVRESHGLTISCG